MIEKHSKYGDRGARSSKTRTCPFTEGKPSEAFQGLAQDPHTTIHQMKLDPPNSQQRHDGRRSDYLATLREAARCSRWRARKNLPIQTHLSHLGWRLSSCTSSTKPLNSKASSLDGKAAQAAHSAAFPSRETHCQHPAEHQSRRNPKQRNRRHSSA